MSEERTPAPPAAPAEDEAPLTSDAKFGRTILVLAVLAVVATGAILLLSGGKGRRDLVIISPHWERVQVEFGRGFNEYLRKKYGGPGGGDIEPVTISWLDQGGTSDDLKYVMSQFGRSPDGIGVDIFFGGGVDPYLRLGQQGLLKPVQLPDEVLDAIPQQRAGTEIYGADLTWFGACLSGFGILYNNYVIDDQGLPEVRTWEDLGQPAYYNWVSAGNPAHSGSMHMVYEIIMQAYGWEKGWEVIARIGANTGRFTAAASDVVKDLEVGEAAAGMAIDVYARRSIADAPAGKMGFVLPDSLTVVNPDGIGVLKGAPHPDLAEEFVQFVLSEEGQRLWVLKQGAPGGPQKYELDRLSVIPGFAKQFGDDAAITEDAYDWLGAFTYDPDLGSRRWDLLNTLVSATVIDVHTELRAAWGELKDLPPDSPRIKELFAPPITQEEAEALLTQLEAATEDPEQDPREILADLRNKWHDEAAARYERLAAGRD